MANLKTAGLVVVHEVDKEIEKLEAMLKARRAHRDAVKQLTEHESRAQRIRKKLAAAVVAAEAEMHKLAGLA